MDVWFAKFVDGRSVIEFILISYFLVYFLVVILDNKTQTLLTYSSIGILIYLIFNDQTYQWLTFVLFLMIIAVLFHVRRDDGYIFIIFAVAVMTQI